MSSTITGVFVDPDSVATGRGDLHALSEEWFILIPRTLRSDQGRRNTRMTQDSHGIHDASRGTGDNGIAPL